MLAFAEDQATAAKAESVFGKTPMLSHGRNVLITDEMTEQSLDKLIADSGLAVISRIRLL